MDVKDFIKQLVESKKRFADEGKKVIKQALAEAFEKNPKLKVISWTQYSPLWNDGEECIFSVNDPAFTNGDAEDLEDSEDYEDYDEEGHGEVKEDDIWIYGAGEIVHGGKQGKKLPGIDDIKSIKLVDDLLTHNEMSDIMEDIFDNHVKVFAFRNGKIKVQDYDHE